jgi:hypothetical protein
MKGKIALVTGANGGLGTHVTQALLDAGATVVGLSREIQQSEFNSPNLLRCQRNFAPEMERRRLSPAWYPTSAGWTSWFTPWAGSPEASPLPKPTTPPSNACSM